MFDPLSLQLLSATPPGAGAIAAAGVPGGVNEQNNAATTAVAPDFGAILNAQAAPAIEAATPAPALNADAAPLAPRMTGHAPAKVTTLLAAIAGKLAENGKLAETGKALPAKLVAGKVEPAVLARIAFVSAPDAPVDSDADAEPADEATTSVDDEQVAAEAPAAIPAQQPLPLPTALPLIPPPVLAEIRAAVSAAAPEATAEGAARPVRAALAVPVTQRVAAPAITEGPLVSLAAPKAGAPTVVAVNAVQIDLPMVAPSLTKLPAATMPADAPVPANASTPATIPASAVLIDLPLAMPAFVAPAEIAPRPTATLLKAKAAKTELSPRAEQTTLSAAPAIESASASPSGPGDFALGQPPMAGDRAEPPAGPSVSVSPEAAAGPAPFLAPQPAQAPLSTAMPTVAVAASAPAGPDMHALVDRLVEARAAARSGGNAAAVSTTIRHAEFGQVSLRFDTREEGFSVSMTSADPGFAPAAQAALAAQQVNPAAESQAANDGSRREQPREQPREQAPAWTGGQNSAQSGNAGNTQQGQHQQPRPQFQPQAERFAPAARNPGATETTATTDAAGSAPGVFA